MNKKDKIPREVLKYFHPDIPDNIFDIIFPKDFYYQGYHYSLKHKTEFHFQPKDDDIYNYFRNVYKSYSEAKIVACYKNQLSKDHDANLIRRVIKLDGTLFK